MIRQVFALTLLMAVAGGCSAQDAEASQTNVSTKASGSPGKQVFDRWCAACHASGPRYPGTASLAVKYGKDMPAALEDREDLTPEVVAVFVRQGVSIMPPFRKTEITDAELAALGAYLSHQPEQARAPSAAK